MFTMMFLRFPTYIFISQDRLQEVKKKYRLFLFLLKALQRTNSEAFRTYFYFLADCTLCAVLNYIIAQWYSSKIHLAQQDDLNTWILEDTRSIYGSIHNRKRNPFSPAWELEWKAMQSPKFLWDTHSFPLSKSTKITMLQRNFISQNTQQHLKCISAFVDCFVMHYFFFKKR